MVEHLLEQRSVSFDQYLDLVEQALFEIDELRSCADYEEDSLGESLYFVEDLDKSMRDLRAAMRDGSYQHGDEDLPFMSLVESLDLARLPFKHLLRIINATHRHGLRNK